DASWTDGAGVRAEITRGHSLRRISQRALPASRGLAHAQGLVGDQLFECARQRLPVVRRNVGGRITPYLPQAWNISEHESAAGERCFERSETERLVAGRQDENRGALEPAGEIPLTESPKKSCRSANVL